RRYSRRWSRQAGWATSPVPSTATPLRRAHQARLSRSRSRLQAREYREWMCRSATHGRSWYRGTPYLAMLVTSGAPRHAGTPSTVTPRVGHRPRPGPHAVASWPHAVRGATAGRVARVTRAVDTARVVAARPLG